MPATLQIIHLDISLHRLAHLILYYSGLVAWEIPWTEEAIWLQYMGSQRVEHDLATQQLCIYVNPSLPAHLILKAMLQGNYYQHHPCFTDKETEAPRGCPRMHRYKGAARAQRPCS